MDLAEYDGNCAESSMISFIKNLWKRTDHYFLIEGKYADSYKEEKDVLEIKKRYHERWSPEPNPQTHPALYDPFDPPSGWRYDPFYEIWIKIK